MLIGLGKMVKKVLSPIVPTFQKIASKIVGYTSFNGGQTVETLYDGPAYVQANNSQNWKYSKDGIAWVDVPNTPNNSDKVWKYEGTSGTVWFSRTVAPDYSSYFIEKTKDFKTWTRIDAPAVNGLLSQHVDITMVDGETLFATANHSSGNRYYRYNINTGSWTEYTPFTDLNNTMQGGISFKLNNKYYAHYGYSDSFRLGYTTDFVNWSEISFTGNTANTLYTVQQQSGEATVGYASGPGVYAILGRAQNGNYAVYQSSDGASWTEVDSGISAFDDYYPIMRKSSEFEMRVFLFPSYSNTTGYTFDALTGSIDQYTRSTLYPPVVDGRIHTKTYYVNNTFYMVYQLNGGSDHSSIIYKSSNGVSGWTEIAQTNIGDWVQYGDFQYGNISVVESITLPAGSSYYTTKTGSVGDYYVFDSVYTKHLAFTKDFSSWEFSPNDNFSQYSKVKILGKYAVAYPEQLELSPIYYSIDLKNWEIVEGSQYNPAGYTIDYINGIYFIRQYLSDDWTYIYTATDETFITGSWTYVGSTYTLFPTENRVQYGLDDPNQTFTTLEQKVVGNEVVYIVSCVLQSDYTQSRSSMFKTTDGSNLQTVVSESSYSSMPLMPNAKTNENIYLQMFNGNILRYSSDLISWTTAWVEGNTPLTVTEGYDGNAYVVTYGSSPSNFNIYKTTDGQNYYKILDNIAIPENDYSFNLTSIVINLDGSINIGGYNFVYNIVPTENPAYPIINVSSDGIISGLMWAGVKGTLSINTLIETQVSIGGQGTGGAEILQPVVLYHIPNNGASVEVSKIVFTNTTSYPVTVDVISVLWGETLLHSENQKLAEDFSVPANGSSTFYFSGATDESGPTWNSGADIYVYPSTVDAIQAELYGKITPWS